MRRILPVLLFLLVLCVRPVAAQPLTPDPRLVSGECENGLRYVVVKHAMPPFRAQVWLRVEAGSLNETPGQRGAAHFVSHLAFCGSANYAPEAVEPLLESLGMRAGADLNSLSGYKETLYRFGLRDATPETLSKALMFLTDIASNLSFPGADVEKERSALLAEQRVPLKPEQRMQEYLIEHIAPGTIIGERAWLGTAESVNALKADDLKAFYRKWYVPANMTLIVVADAEPDVVVPLIKSSLGRGKRAAAAAGPELGVKAYPQALALVTADGELKAAQIFFFRIAPSQPPVRTQEDLRKRVLDSLAVATFNRRVSTKISTGKFKFSTAGCFCNDVANLCQLTGGIVAADAGAWREALGALGEEVQRARLHGLYQSEIEETKKLILQNQDKFVKNEPVRQAQFYAEAISASLGNGDVLMSAQQTADQLKAILAALDPKTVSARFAELLDPSAAFMFLLQTPTGAQVPKEAELLAAGLAALRVTPAPEEEFVQPEALMSQKPAPGKVVEEQTHEGTGVWSAWLGNGARVHYRFMDINKGQAAITVGIAGGLIEETDVTRGLTEAGSVAWSRPATSKLPSYAIRQLTGDKKIRVLGGPGIDNLVLAVSGQTEDLETGMQLMHLLLTDPMIESPGLDQWRQDQLKDADARRAQPKEVFNDSMLDLLYPATELRPRSLTRPQVERVSLEAAQAWIRRQVTAGPLEVSVVGDLPRERAVELVTTYIGSLPKRERISSRTFDDKRSIEHLKGPQTLTREVNGLTETSFVMAGFLGADAKNLRDTRLLGLAATILKARLAAGVQAQEHLVQNVFVESRPAQEFPGFGLFGVYSVSEPGKAEAATKRIFEVFDDLAREGPSLEELSATKRETALQIDSALANPEFWSGQLALLDYHGLQLDDISGGAKAYEGITPEDVKRAFAAYYRPEARLRFTLVQKAPPKTTPEAPKDAPAGPNK